MVINHWDFLMCIISEAFFPIHWPNYSSHRHINTKLINYYAVNPALLMAVLIALRLFCQ